MRDSNKNCRVSSGMSTILAWCLHASKRRCKCLKIYPMVLSTCNDHYASRIWKPMYYFQLRQHWQGEVLEWPSDVSRADVSPNLETTWRRLIFTGLDKNVPAEKKEQFESTKWAQYTDWSSNSRGVDAHQHCECFKVCKQDEPRTGSTGSVWWFDKWTFVVRIVYNMYMHDLIGEMRSMHKTPLCQWVELTIENRLCSVWGG